MSEAENTCSVSSREEVRHSTSDMLTTDSDDMFFQCLYEFMEHEKQFLQCPAEGPDELRYIVYRSAFNQVFYILTYYLI